MKRMDISEELKISVYHEGILLLLAYSSFDHILPLLKESKRERTLIAEITEYSNDELYKKYQIGEVRVSGSSSWTSFLQELLIISRKYKEVHGLVLGAVIEIMGELNWQDSFDIRKFLTLFLNSSEELAHLKIATAGTPYANLEYWRESVIEEAKSYASYKSKIA